MLRSAEVWSADAADGETLTRLTGERVVGWGVGLPGRVWAGDRPARVPDIGRDLSMERAAAAMAAGARGACAVPVRAGARVVGVLEVFLPDAGRLTGDLEAVLERAAAELGEDLPAAVPQADPVERELQRRAAQQAAVAEFGRQALGSADIEAVIDTAVRLIQESLGADLTALLTLDEEGRELTVRAGTGWGDGVIGTTIPARGGSPAGYALLRGEPVVVDDIAAETRFESPPLLAEHGVTSVASVVVRAPTGALGALSAHSRTRRRFSPEDVHFMRTVANVVAAALLRAQAEDELRRANALLDAIVTGATDAIYVKDREGRVLFANEAGAASIARTPAEVLGRRTSELSDTLADLEPEDVAAMESGEWRTSEGEFVLGGHRRWFLTTRGPYRSADGRVAGVIGIARDITDRRLAERRARLLADAGRLLATAPDPERALAETARLPVPALADLCEVTLVAPDGSVRTLAIVGRDGSVEQAARCLRDRYPTDPAADAGIAAVLRTGEAVLVRGITPEMMAAAARDAGHRELLSEVPLTSVIIAPLSARGRTFGTITLGTLPGRPELDDSELDLVVEMAGRAALATDNARLSSERKATIDTLQRALLPPDLPDVPGLELGAAFRAGGEGLEVGGDFYDVLPSGDGWLVVVGDVCGRGAEAAAITAIARHTLRGAAMYDGEPASLLRALNRALLTQRLNLRFCTVLCARLRLEGDRLAVRLANGGHPGPLLVRGDGGAEIVEAPGTLIGVLPAPNVGEASLQLAAGDSLVLYTDGLLDVRRAHGAVRALDLAPAVARAAPRGAGAIAATLAADALAAAGPEGLGDDVAVLAIRVPAGATADD